MAGPQFVYVMKGLSKTYPGGKQVLKDIWLSFYPGAKIGIVGVNGSGKSTLMKIMAGLDPEFTGEAWAADGVRMGYLSQEPQLDPDKDVRGNVMEGVAKKQALVDRYNEIASNYTDETADEMAKLQDEIEAQGLWDLDSKVDQAMDALRCPDGDARVETLIGRRAPPGGAVQALAGCPRHSAAGRSPPTIWTRSRWNGWNRTLREYKAASSLVTHDRYFLDNVTSWILELDRGKGIPHEGNYSSFLGVQEKRLKQESSEEAAQQRTIAREREWISQSPKARQAKSKARINAYEDLVRKSQEQRQGTAQIMIPVAERLGDLVIEAENLAKGYGDRLLYEGVNFKLPAGGIVGVIGPNGAGKTTLFRMLTGQEKPDAGTREGRLHRAAGVMSTQFARHAGGPQQDGLSGNFPAAPTSSNSARPRSTRGPIAVTSPSRAATSRRRSDNCRGGERNRVASGQDAAVGRQSAAAGRTHQ